MDDVAKDIFQLGQHGYTFGGNPVACAGCIRILNQACNEAFLSSFTA